jgi:phage-related holin
MIAAIAQLNPTFFILAFAAICADLLTGFIIKGVIPHKVSSSIMREGLVHKSWEIAIIWCAVLVDIAVYVGMGVSTQLLSTATCGFIFVMELASVAENALEGNPELAGAPLIKYVARAKKEQQESDPDETADLSDVGKHMPRGD